MAFVQGPVSLDGKAQPMVFCHSCQYRFENCKHKEKQNLQEPNSSHKTLLGFLAYTV